MFTKVEVYIAFSFCFLIKDTTQPGYRLGMFDILGDV
jgi:hypothetical protein